MHGAGRTLSEWRAYGAPAGRHLGPGDLPGEGDAWIPARVPGTAAGALRAAGSLDLSGSPRRLDAEDWWWRTTVPRTGNERSTVEARDGKARLHLDGLATLADVWWNEELVVSSDDMFIEHAVDVTLQESNDLVIRCRALDPVLREKRPRPRWRAPMIEQAHLRFIRTTLLGRTPGWSPPVPPVGPWRAVWLEDRGALAVEGLSLSPRLDGTSGTLEVRCHLRAAKRPAEVSMVVRREGREHRAALASSDDASWHGALTIADVARWWPHTHGEPCLYQVALSIDGVEMQVGSVGFRTIELDTEKGGFALSVNGTPVFCRGACWTPLDPITLSAPPEAYARAFDRVVDGGMNMLRVSGPMVYEEDLFYAEADRRGVLVWQDFMFANMDYPTDAPFLDKVRLEARQILTRLAGHPSIGVLCGNSECEQQAAMWGAPRSIWQSELFDAVLPALARELLPDVPYWPSSAHGGAFPHQNDRGTTSYYGVGAYLRPLDDARSSEVRFATECLAFSNVPDEGSLPGGPSTRVHHPAWKARTPRDLGAGWDFDDVRDHYVKTLFGVDPNELRSLDHDRYLALGRAATGEAMAATFGEWRRARSTCRGGLVLFLRDLWEGAGWGLLDAEGAPKPAYRVLARALQPVALFVSDEGLNGLHAHLINDRPEKLTASLEVLPFRHLETPLSSASRIIEVAAHGSIEVPLADLFDHWTDLTSSHRFGPRAADLVVVRSSWQAESGAGSQLEAFYFGPAFPSHRHPDIGLTAIAVPTESGAELTVSSRVFAQSVSIVARGFEPDDDWFHLAPGATRKIALRRTKEGAELRGLVRALNVESETAIKVQR